MIELAITVGALGVLASVAIFGYSSVTERAAKEQVEAVKSALQSVVTQATDRCHQNLNPATSPGCNINTQANTLNAASVINVVRLPGTATLTGTNGGAYTLQMNNGGFGATYQVANNGTVRVTSLTSSFKSFYVDSNGNIKEK